jgi:predicted Zn-ribbon and HTH transcriptional regulator
MPLPPGEDDCLANNKPQRKRKAINYVEMDDHSQGAAITSPQGQRHRAGEGMGDEADGDGDMYGADSTDTAMVSAAATDSESAIESTGGDAESQRAQLRRRVQCTLERMAATPLELRRKLKHAESISQRSPYQLFWRAFCSTCGMRFERVEGPLQLASHCGWHHMKDLLEYRCGAVARAVAIPAH